MKIKISKNKKGFTLLFSVLLITLILAVGASIINVALKETILSGVGRESQYAFYAANTGIECAMYWDRLSTLGDGIQFENKYVFATSSASQEIGDMSSIKCADNVISDVELADGNGWDRDLGASSATTTFGINIPGRTTSCAFVSVSKVFDSLEDVTLTSITSRGYNTCDKTNPRRIERGLQLFY